MDYTIINKKISLNEWPEAIAILEKQYASTPDDVDVVCNLQFCYGLYLRDYIEEWEGEEFDHYREANILLFRESQTKYNDNPVWLFYIGFMIVLAEWLYGLQDDGILGEEMMERACALEPDNLLYQSANYACDHALYAWFEKKFYPGGLDKASIVAHGPIGEYVYECISQINDPDFNDEACKYYILTHSFSESDLNECISSIINDLRNHCHARQKLHTEKIKCVMRRLPLSYETNSEQKENRQRALMSKETFPLNKLAHKIMDDLDGITNIRLVMYARETDCRILVETSPDYMNRIRHRFVVAGFIAADLS